MGRIWSVLFWSVIAAAFIGPGTVTTAASSGAGFGLSLLWALVFSTFACWVLQEAAARVTLASGRDLGQALRERSRGGMTGVAVLLLVLGAIVVGCAAYEAGNILGGVAGAALATDLSRATLTVVSGLIAAAVLWIGAPKIVARLLAMLVAWMGVAFLVTAWQLRPDLGALMLGAVAPRFPEGSSVLILGLVGTTVVPYNLFMGSGLARGQRLPELRFGLAVAVVFGGVISMGIVVVGTAVDGPFSFDALAGVLEQRLGTWSRLLFGAGLFAAGISSAITAPLAAALTARSMIGSPASENWGDRGRSFRVVWLGVLVVGVAFGLAEVRPVPAILLAQALNGVLLPLVAVFLFLTVNDRRLMGTDEMNRAGANLALGAAVVATVMLGLVNVARAASTALGFSRPPEAGLVLASAAVVAAGAIPLWAAVRQRRRFGDGDDPRP